MRCSNEHPLLSTTRWNKCIIDVSVRVQENICRHQQKPRLVRSEDTDNNTHTLYCTHMAIKVTEKTVLRSNISIHMVSLLINYSCTAGFRLKLLRLLSVRLCGTTAVGSRVPQIGFYSLPLKQRDIFTSIGLFPRHQTNYSHANGSAITGSYCDTPGIGFQCSSFYGGEPKVTHKHRSPHRHVETDTRGNSPPRGHWRLR